jgi:hypothetical protein
MRLIIINAQTNWPCSTNYPACRTLQNTASNERLSIVAIAGGRVMERQVIRGV